MQKINVDASTLFSFLLSLLFGSMMESKSSTIKLEDTPLKAFKLLLGYMYSGSLESTDQQVIIIISSLDHFW